MITEAYLMEKLRECKTLMNTQITKEFMQETHKRIQNGFDPPDLDRAMEEVLNGEHSRITYPILAKALNNARARRYDAESKHRQETEDRDKTMFWDRRKGIKYEPCLDRKCGSCPQEKAKYCEDVARATLAMIKQKYSMEDCEWSISERLAKEFPGYGFEKDCKPKRWIIKKKDGTMVPADGPSVPELKLVRSEWDRVEDLYDDFVKEE